MTGGGGGGLRRVFLQDVLPTTPTVGGVQKICPHDRKEDRAELELQTLTFDLRWCDGLIFTEIQLKMKPGTKLCPQRLKSCV